MRDFAARIRVNIVHCIGVPIARKGYTGISLGYNETNLGYLPTYRDRRIERLAVYKACRRIASWDDVFGRSSQPLQIDSFNIHPVKTTNRENQ